MKKIVLFCAGGLSTSFLVDKMRKAAKDMAYECEINAYSINEVKKHIEGVDIILLGPQVRFQLENVKKIAPNVPVVVIDAKVYGTFNGETILNLVKKTLNEFN